MNVFVVQVKLIVIECPCAELCRLRPPLDELAERLRREMRYGRDFGTRAADWPHATVDPVDFFKARFQQTESPSPTQGCQS